MRPKNEVPPVPLVGVLLVMTGLAVTVVGSSGPEDVYTGSLAERYAAIAADERAFLWHGALFAVTMPMALGALYLLYLRVGAAGRMEAARRGFVLLAVATAAFVVEVVFRFTVILNQARDVAAGAAPPDTFLEHPGLGELSPTLLVFRLTGAVGFAMLAWAASRSPVVGRIPGRVLAVIGAAAFLTIPLAPYMLAVTPLGAVLLVRYFLVPETVPREAQA